MSTSCQTFKTTLNDAIAQLIGAGHEPRIASVPSPQDEHVHVGGPFHTTATPEISPMEFLIPATETFLDLNQSYFEMEVKLQTSTPASLALSPFGKFGLTLIRMTINGEECPGIGTQ